jgi:hypothetical protein
MIMRTKDPRKRLVSEQLRRFFAAVRDRATHGVDELWKQVERRFLDKKPDDRKSPGGRE